MTPESTARVWIAICETCRELGLAGRLLPGLSVACIFRGHVPDDQSEFFRTAAMNRGVRMEFFEDLNAALQWLGARTRTLD